MGKSGGKWWGCGGNVVILNDNRSYVPYTRDICRKTRCQRAYSPAFGPAQGAGRRGGRRIFYSPLDAGDVFGDVHVPHVGGGVGQDPAFESLCAGAPRLHPPFHGGGALCGGRCGGAGEYPADLAVGRISNGKWCCLRWGISSSCGTKTCTNRRSAAERVPMPSWQKD